MTYNDLKVGFFLVLRYIRGASWWTTTLISFLMMLTFLNLTVISGLLEGIVVGSFDGLRNYAIGDVYVSPKDGEQFINRSQQIISALKDDGRVKVFSPRDRINVEIVTEDEFFNVINFREQRKSVGSAVFGINPEAEQQTTNLRSRILEGEYFNLNEENRNEILIGSALIKRYSPFGDDVLSDVYPGDSVYILTGKNVAKSPLEEEGGESGIFASNESSQETIKKYRVKGIFRTKSGEFDFAVMMHQSEVRGHNVNPGNDASGIAVRLFNPADSEGVRDSLLAKGFGTYAEIETVEQAIGTFLDDIRTIFKTLGIAVGSIGLTVASITIFIIIFVAASSRRKFIGILKAIGITPDAIRLSYVFYALFFAVVGILIGMGLLLGVLIPFFKANPIPFPFSDGILYITPLRLVLFTSLLFFSTLLAGLIPAHRVVRQPAIDAVRGR